MPRHHSDWIKAYVSKVAPKSEAPERYLYWSAVATIGGALRRRVYLDMGSFKWYPNWYIVFVGPPGLVKKTTTVDLAMSLLREVPGVNFGADCTTWEGFVEQVERAKDAFATGSTSGKALMDQEYEVSSALTFAISEWGTFLDPQNYMQTNILTDFWDCKDTPWRKTTKTQGDNVIVAPFVNMIAGTTPDWMLQNFKSQFGGWGFSSRCIFLYCAEIARTVAYPDEIWGDEIETWKRPFIEDLCTIAELEGPYRLHPDARAFGRDWYTQHQDRIIQFEKHPNKDPWTGYYLARKQTHIHKLALCLAASRRSERVVLLPDLEEATRRCDDVETELGQVFGLRSGQTRAAKINTDVWRGLANGVRVAGGRITERKAHQFMIRFLPYGEAKALLDQLLRSGYLAREVEGLEAFLVLGPEAGVEAND